MRRVAKRVEKINVAGFSFSSLLNMCEKSLESEKLTERTYEVSPLVKRDVDMTEWKSHLKGSMGTMWPDDGIKSYPISPKIAQKVVTYFFIIVTLLEIAQKSQKY